MKEAELCCISLQIPLGLFVALFPWSIFLKGSLPDTHTLVFIQMGVITPLINMCHSSLLWAFLSLCSSSSYAHLSSTSTHYCLILHNLYMRPYTKLTLCSSDIPLLSCLPPQLCACIQEHDFSVQYLQWRGYVHPGLWQVAAHCG